MSKKITFSEYGPKLIEALKKIDFFEHSGEDYKIVGFARIGVENEVSDTINIGGRSIPTLVIVGQTTGIVHQIALFALLPDLEKELNG